MRRRACRSDARRIFVVVPGGVAGPGGMCAVVRQCAREWQARGRRPGLAIIDSRGNGGTWRMAARFGGTVLRVIAAGLRGEIALLHLHMAERGSVLRKGLLLHLGRLLGVPVVLHLHGAEFAGFYGALPPFLRARVRALLGAADRVLVLGAATRDRLVAELGVPAPRVVVHANAVAAPAVRRPAPGDAGCRLLFLGAIGERKGLDVLLRALAAPAVSGLDWRLDVAGPGELAAFRGLAAGLGLSHRVAFAGPVDAGAAAGLLERADLLVLPSRAEGMPMAILEAMAHGRPVVATRVGDVADAVQHGRTGLLVPPGDSQALAEALALLVADPDLRRRLGDAGRRRFAHAFDIGAANDRLEPLLASVAAASPARPLPRGAAALGSGAALGQALALLGAPLLTRLYDVAAFGVFGTFSAVVTAIGAVATLKYEQAIVLEREAAGAADALRLCCATAFATALVSLAGFTGLAAASRASAWQPAAGALLRFGAVAVLTIGLLNALGFWFTRQRGFRALGVYQVARTALALALQFAGAALGGGGSALLVGGQVAGQGLALGGLAVADLGDLRRALGPGWRWAAMLAAARRYRRFALYGAPQTLLHLLSAALPMILLPVLFGPVQSGLVWLACRLLILPSQIVVESLRSVFFRRAADLRQAGTGLRRPLARAGVRVGLLCLPVPLLLLACGPALFAAVFGAAWREAGAYAAILSVPWWIETVAMPSSVLAAVLERQRAWLAIEVASLFARTVALLAGATGGPRCAVALYAAAASLGSLTLIVWSRAAAGRAEQPVKESLLVS